MKNELSHHVFRSGIFILILILMLVPVNADQAEAVPNGPGSGQLQAPTPEPLPDISTYEGTAQFTFAQLGKSSFELRSPFSRQFSQDFPYRWAIIGGEGNSYIDLHYDMVDLDSNQPYLPPEVELPTLEIYVNGVLAGAFVPTPGVDQTSQVTIPASAIRESTDNSHRFRFIYRRGIDCDTDAKALLQIYSDSTITIRYESTQPELNLANFPRPLVQESFIPETVQFVIPDEFSENDLNAAAVAAAAIGNRSFGNVSVSLLTAAQATSAALSNSSAVIVGLPSSNDFLAQLYQASDNMPTQLSADGASIVGGDEQAIEPEDGVLQLVPSPLNPDQTYLIVTGRTDTAVMRAAQALSGVTPSLPLNGNLAVIQEVAEDFLTPETGEMVEIFPLSEFGFEDTTFYGMGSQSTSVSFFVPRNWKIQDGAALHLAYIHSSQLSAGNSTLTVSLNGEPIGNAPINPEETGEQQAVIPIQIGDIRLGEYNRLTFDVTQNFARECVAYDIQVNWLRVRDTSFLYLPHELVSLSEELGGINNPFFYLVSEPVVSNIWIALPPQPNAGELNGMLRFAHLLGGELLKPSYKFMVTASDRLYPEGYEGYHLVAFGRPTANPIITSLNDHMPQPFAAGEDNLGQQVGNVIFRLPVNYSVGVIQAFPTPWNPFLGATVISGTTDEGVSWSIDIFTDEERVHDLNGDLVLTREDAVEVFSTVETSYPGIEVGLEEIAPEEVTTGTVEPAAPESTSQLASELPERYQTQEQAPPINFRFIYGLIGAGFLVAVIGTALTVFRRRP